ncbi:hypothetical protein DCCM_3273 [Desulfocucumis palustris]|uniref:Uncharacterized protein n=1 Tax=Desulfocucumis palustris TaxID=1898651 RepID=A0A2L2XJR2_9FIRM|nr:AbrB/MazE/SpoVT family DNA-binding domain-containing protein [Desulfocucumis palustris]GBF34161.1 hypothetical protein DCCM_3273 [Desulfocucumis palustris]
MPEVIQQVQKRMLVSLAQIAKKIAIKEGDHVALEIRDGGVFIRPVAWHDKSQEYFWSEEWQQKMKQSDEAIKEGKIKTFTNSGDLLKELGEDDADNHSD